MHIAAHSRGLIDAGVPLEIFAEFIEGVASHPNPDPNHPKPYPNPNPNPNIEGVREQYTAATYNLATNNCNHFSNAVAEFLAGVQVLLRPWPHTPTSTPRPSPRILQLLQNSILNTLSMFVYRVLRFRPMTFSIHYPRLSIGY